MDRLLRSSEIPDQAERTEWADDNLLDYLQPFQAFMQLQQAHTLSGSGCTQGAR